VRHTFAARFYLLIAMEQVSRLERQLSGNFDDRTLLLMA